MRWRPLSLIGIEWICSNCGPMQNSAEQAFSDFSLRSKLKMERPLVLS